MSLARKTWTCNLSNDEGDIASVETAATDHDAGNKCM